MLIHIILRFFKVPANIVDMGVRVLNLMFAQYVKFSPESDT